MIEYTKLSDALAALESRKHLRPKVEAFLAERGVGLPWDKDLGNGKPLAVLFRQVATPNYEIIRFLSIASGFGMQPVILEYTEDRLSMENSYKKSLVCLPIVKKISTKGHIQYEKKWICEPSQAKPQTSLSEIKTRLGQSLVESHHELLKKVAGNYEMSLIDASAWFKRLGGAKDYYEIFFSLFVSHGILFESYSPQDPKEAPFIESIVEPNFLSVKSLFNKSPLIVPINPTGVEDSSFWVCYPDGVLE